MSLRVYNTVMTVFLIPPAFQSLFYDNNFSRYLFINISVSDAFSCAGTPAFLKPGRENIRYDFHHPKKSCPLKGQLLL
ncbi:hypothetical protein SAMN04488054_11358 [Salibacterium qingdaonense]|uniref:Uncharacterized protein n=1 Tax=Salibacterium qingdaonense TaxID=266892 RepID=A0A1I4MUC7_9BACI|nr:hypothetical protein SAMN04488054_11358 [Salibacterium qingdaonense]